jgi:ABC-type phosphate transport system permease subunit
MTAASDIIDRFVTYIIDPIILLIFATGFFLFTWGLVEFLMHLEEPAARQKGKDHMIWGIVGMLVMVSVYGIIALIDNTFGLNISNPDVNRMDSVTSQVNFF